MPFWFNIQTQQVESDENRGADADVLGPYDTMEEAGNALQHARENTDKWDAEDRAWDDADQED